MLRYALQVAELQKVLRLEAPRSLGSLPSGDLGPRQAEARCLVCDALGAAPCSVCSSVGYCSAEHQRQDAPWHQRVCELLRHAREDAALRATVPLATLGERLRSRSVQDRAKLSGWDAYLPAELAGAERRVATDLASRPLTLARLLVELELVRPGKLRVHVMAASATEVSALALYEELGAFFPEVNFEISFIGPQLPTVPLPNVPGVRFSLHTGDYRRALWASLGTPDLVVGFNAGLLLYRSWQATLFDLLRCGAPFAVTSYRTWEAKAEAQVLASVGGSCVRPPAPNAFASLACRRSTTIANDVSFDNAHLSVWR